MKGIERGMGALLASLMLALLLVAMPMPATALELLDSKLQIHGFGHQGYLLTSHNKWQDADSKGSFNFNNFGLLFAAQPQDDLTIWAQLFADDSSSLRLDWAFVDYKFSDQLRLRGGQVRDPIGLLSETRDIKYLQLSTIKPYIYQEEAEMIAEAFRGVSLIYSPDLLDGNLTIDVFGGEPKFFEGENTEEELRHLIGGRISYKTPLDGLSLIASASTSKEERPETGEEGRQNLYVGSIAYENHNFDLKSEYAYLKDIETRSFGYYAQAGYTFFNKLTPFVRYDYIALDKDQRSDPSFYQKGISFGIGYKFNSNVALKVENHIIRGYGLPAHVEIGEDEDGEELTEVPAGSGRKNWNLFAASLNFIF